MKKRIGYLSLDIANTFNELLYESILTRSNELGFSLFTVHGGRIDSDDEWEKQRNMLYKLIQTQEFDGLIVANVFDFISDEKAREFLEQFGQTPIVLLSKYIDGYSSVRVNNIPGYEAMLELVFQNRVPRGIGIIAGPKCNFDVIERMQVLEKFSKKHNVTINEENVFYGSFNFFDGVNGVAAMFDNKVPTVDLIVCFNDNMALGAMQALKKRGLKVPQDVMVTGFDNTTESFFVIPSLTTVAYPVTKIGNHAVNSIYEIISQNKKEIHKEIATHCIIRGSTQETNRVPPILFLDSKLESSLPCGDNNFSHTTIKKEIEEIIESYYLPLNDEKKNFIINIIQHLFQSLKEQANALSFTDYLGADFFDSSANSWAYPVIIDVLTK